MNRKIIMFLFLVGIFLSLVNVEIASEYEPSPWGMEYEK